jgi:UDP:flavonoid glycosyltransferase YjiC (YdhE family)
LLTRYPEQLPNNLPNHVRHFDYAPFSTILPRCRALISHGGIGTISAGLAAGIPQLVMPIFSDQFDNADRLKHLGTGDFLYPEKFNADRVSAKIKSLVFSDSIRQRCQELSRKIRIQDSIETTCDLIEAESNKFN